MLSAQKLFYATIFIVLLQMFVVLPQAFAETQISDDLLGDIGDDIEVSDTERVFDSEAKNEVRDLYYGVVLYDFYQQNYYSAAVNLLVAQKKNRLNHHRQSSELLLAGLYLSYGLHSEAEIIFQRLIDQRVDPEVRDRAWFYLGKIRYQKGLFEESESALNRVGDSLDAALQEEFRTLKSNLYMAQKKYPQAAVVLSEMSLKNDEAILSANYVKFNLAVALVGANRQSEGIELLEEVANLQSSAADLKALRDKANLALGYSILRKDPAGAKKFLQRVRLHGPFSNRALLGLGWAEVELQRYEQALLPWGELSQRRKDDIAVFESMLAMGHALERLNAYPQAMQSYRKAISIFEQELQALDATVEVMKSGRLWAELLSQVSQNEMGWFWEAEFLPNTEESRYLKNLMASHQFHEAIKNLRDLQFLLNKLNRWESEIPALEGMLELRRETFQAQSTRLTPQQTMDKVLDVRTTRDAYVDELAQIDAIQDVYALASEHEQSLLLRLSKVEERIWQLSNRPGKHSRRLEDYRSRYQFYKGLLDYDIKTTYAIRFRKVEKSLKSLDAELDAAIVQQVSLQRARANTPVTFEGYGHRIDGLQLRMAGLRENVMDAFKQQQHLLQIMVDGDLDKLRLNITDYLDQARFSLAHLQDISSEAAATAGALR